MLSLLAALGFLAALSLFGIVLLRQLLPWLTALELVAFGPVAGTVLGSVLVLGLAVPFGLLPATLAVTAFSAIGAWLYWPRGDGSSTALGRAGAFATRLRGQFGVWPAVVIGLIVVRLAFLWAGALTLDEDGLWAGHGYIWSDWTLHLGDTTSFAYTDNFPPTHPRLAGAPIAYHYLVSITSAGMVALGMSPLDALPLQSFLFSITLVLALFAFILRLGGDRAVATLGLVLFVAGGSLGWVLLFGGSSGPLETLLTNPWDAGAQFDANFRWLNPYIALVMSQRAALYGIPIVLLVLTIVLHASASPGWREFAIAGLLAGFLPIAHISAFASLGLIAPVLVLLFPHRGWIAFFAVWVAVGGIFLFGVQGGEARASSSLRWEPGWLMGDDAWPWFWIKNFGLYLPLGAVGLLVPRLLPGRSRRMLLAFLPIFVVANLFLLGDYDWDNSKVLLYVFLALSILSAAALVGLWRVQRDVLSRALIGLAVLAMIGSGLLANLSQLMGNDRARLAAPADLAVAEWALEETAPDAIFAVGLEHNDPIPMLTGRRVITSYAPWITNLGLDPSRQEADLRSIMRLDEDAEELIARYGVDYVAIGQWEVDELDADVDGFRDRYPIAYESEEYLVFDVGR